jgi:hypothetical protein
MLTNNKNWNIILFMFLKKFAVFLLLFIIICCMAGVYGFLHDQISYTISPEYFTHLKFHQFNISESLHNRIGVGIVGIMATWWMGIVIGIIIIPVGLIIPNWKNYLIVLLQTFICICITALLIGIVAMVYGLIKFDLNNLPMFIYNNIPDGVEDKINFCVVGNMHNFSYIGGIVGIVIGIIYIIIIKIKIKKIINTPNVA